MPVTPVSIDGSSPLARGTLHLQLRGERPARLIPARAGNTGLTVRSLKVETAHPRSRGEHYFEVTRATAYRGSSPLARGTQVVQAPAFQRLRLIPARAGNTYSSTPSSGEPSAHPRSRGEHQSAPELYRPLIGSSPLARGTLGRAGSSRGQVRLIPARAGNTLRGRLRTRYRAAHPRSRGEHKRAVEKISNANGSSPLARGTRSGFFRILFFIRLIPARAGNTRRRTDSTAFSPAHPRSRGEHVPVRLVAIASSGSSPLARGTRSVTVSM